MVVMYIAGEGVADYCVGVADYYVGVADYYVGMAAAGRGVELGYSASIQTSLAIG